MLRGFADKEIRSKRSGEMAHRALQVSRRLLMSRLVNYGGMVVEISGGSCKSLLDSEAIYI